MVCTFEDAQRARVDTCIHLFANRLIGFQKWKGEKKKDVHFTAALQAGPPINSTIKPFIMLILFGQICVLWQVMPVVFPTPLGIHFFYSMDVESMPSSVSKKMVCCLKDLHENQAH